MSIATTTLRTAVFPRSTVLTSAGFVIAGVAFLSLLAQIAIPVPGSPVPVTGQTLGVLLLATSYGATLGTTTFFTYLLVGALGAPVFANSGSGVERIVGATGGYLVGMLLTSALFHLSGNLFSERFHKKNNVCLPLFL